MSDEKQDKSRIYEKLDILDMRLDSMDKSLIKQEFNLREHMKRSDNLEAMVEKIEDKMIPVEKHVNMMEGVVKFLGLTSLVLGIILGFLKIFSVI